MTRRTKRALVTGGSAGLGAAMVQRLTDQGVDVVLVDLERPSTDDPKVEFVRCDFADRDQVDLALPELIAAGPYDLVVFNAGISATGRFEDLNPETHVEVLRVNAESPMVIAAGLLSAAAVRKGGAMVFVSSLSHFTGYPGAAAYAASKDTLAVFAKSMRKIAETRKITITVAFPGPLRTAHAERHAPKGSDAGRRMDPGIAADRILGDAFAGRKTSIPGPGNRALAIAGRLLPKPATALMRRLIYDRLG